VITAAQIGTMSRRELRELLFAGHALTPSAIENAAYRGVSLGLPRWMERLSWKTFQKAFHRDPTTGVLRGWNVRVEQRGIDAPTMPRRLRDGRPWTFGHFEIVSAADVRAPRGLEKSLVLDYGRGDNGRLDPLRLLRDPIVAVNEGSAELLLGWSYLDLGLFTLSTPSFFTLEREGAIEHVPESRR
jgi:hypothetical protein